MKESSDPVQWWAVAFIPLRRAQTQTRGHRAQGATGKSRGTRTGCVRVQTHANTRSSWRRCLRGKALGRPTQHEHACRTQRRCRPPPAGAAAGPGAGPRLPWGPRRAHEEGCPHRPDSEWVVTDSVHTSPTMRRRAAAGYSIEVCTCTGSLATPRRGQGRARMAVALVQGAWRRHSWKPLWREARRLASTSNAWLPGSVPAASRTLTELRDALHSCSLKFRETP